MLHDVDTSQCAEQPLPRGAPDADGMAKETRRNHGFLRLDNLPKGGAGMVHHVHATPHQHPQPGTAQCTYATRSELLRGIHGPGGMGTHTLEYEDALTASAAPAPTMADPLQTQHPQRCVPQGQRCAHTQSQEETAACPFAQCDPQSRGSFYGVHLRAVQPKRPEQGTTVESSAQAAAGHT